MSEEVLDLRQPADVADLDVLDGDVETVDGLPVLAEVRAIERVSPVPLPVFQAAAAVATGFMAGAATVALINRRAARQLVRGRRRVDRLPIVGSRTFLVDVHVIAKPRR